MQIYNLASGSEIIGRECAFCGATLCTDDQVVQCPVCEAAHHTDCWSCNGDHCARLACPGKGTPGDARKRRKFVVTPPGYDDIDAVLFGLGEGFDHSIVRWEDLQRGQIPEGCEVLFVNCASEARVRCDAKAIRQFVERGGSLYASDWAGSVVQSAFPEMLTFDQEGQSCSSLCNVVDEGLREIIGGTIEIQFDLGSWWRVQGAKPGTRVYVESTLSGSGNIALPIIVGFSHGRGHVIYTSFHNKAQVSEAEEKLLRFLVLRPILAQAVASSTEAARAKQFAPGKEIIAAIDPAKNLGPFVYKPKDGEGLLYILQWEGIGTLELTIRDPSGTVVYEHSASRPPLQYENSKAIPGDWSCYVRAVNVPYNNFPFVLSVATRSSTSKPVAVAKPPRGIGVPAGVRGTYAKQWGSTHPGCLIILLDQSSSMDEAFGNTQFGAGRKKSDMVATVLNNLLHEFIKTNTVGTQVKPRADIAVLAYEGVSIRSALGGALANRDSVTLPDLIANPLRIETRMRKETDDAGNIVTVPVQFPIWVDPQIGTATPMCAALGRAREFAERWVSNHPNHYPPVVINITDGASTDGDPLPLAYELSQVSTTDGATLLFNVYLTTQPQLPLEFPTAESEIPGDAEGLGLQLFRMSSEIPDTGRKSVASATGQVLKTRARGLILNGDAGSVRQMFVFATLGATQIDPNR